MWPGQLIFRRSNVLAALYGIKMGGIGARGVLCGCCGSESCSWQCCLWCCCRRGRRAEKNPAATEICRLRWNWLFVVLLGCLVTNSYSSILPSFHQFVTNPTAQQLQGTGRENKIEAGLGLPEKFYHVAMSVFSVGEFLGALIGSIASSRLPYWYSIMGALLCHITGYVVYAAAVSGWMIIVARIMSGTFVGMQTVITFSYFGVSYQDYLDTLEPEGRMKEETKAARVKDKLFSFYAVAVQTGTSVGPGFAAILAQFPYRFRSIAWYNIGLGMVYILFQLSTFRGESKCHCENSLQKRKCSLPERSRLREMICSNMSLILTLGFLILGRGLITSRFIIYEQLFNPILSDSFGFSVKQTSYFFVLLLPAAIVGALVLVLMQRLKLNARIITIVGVFSCTVGMVLMADWQSIPYDPCTDFSLYYHPEIANKLSNGTLDLCLVSPSGCQWSQSGGSVHNVSAMENKIAVEDSFLQYVEMPESNVHIHGVHHQALNATAYNVAMNVCESLRESQYHCHWIPEATGTLCEACPPICRGIGHTLNFAQYTIGAFIYRFTLPIARTTIMIVISDIVSKDYQPIVMGLAYASTGLCRSVTPLFMGAAYEGAQKRTFLAMSIMIAIQIPIMLMLLLLYRKLGKLRRQQMQVSATEPLPSASIRGSDQDSVSDETEMSELLAPAPEKRSLEDSSNL